MTLKRTTENILLSLLANFHHAILNVFGWFSSMSSLMAAEILCGRPGRLYIPYSSYGEAHVIQYHSIATTAIT